MGLPTMAETIRTPITDLLNIKVPIFLAGMNVAAGPECAAAVTNAGGMGVIGGVGYTPEYLREAIHELKGYLKDKNAPFGVDLLLPQVGGSARKTNKDYTGGQLPELIDVVIQEKASLFVSAVGVPPKFAVDKLHAAGIPVMNMIGAPKHAQKAIDAGCDIICAQGGEGGGHTGDTPTSILIPMVADICKNAKSPLTGQKVSVVAAGGIYDGRGLAMSLSLGADAVWVGTRFVASKEAGAPKRHKKAVVESTVNDTIRTLIYTGRPLRCIKTPFIMSWEDHKQAEIKQLTSEGVIPIMKVIEDMEKSGEELDPQEQIGMQFMLSGQVAGAIKEVLTCEEIIEEMMTTAIEIMRAQPSQIVDRAKYTPKPADAYHTMAAKSKL